jgi:hypothetical protein
MRIRTYRLRPAAGLWRIRADGARFGAPGGESGDQ